MLASPVPSAAEVQANSTFASLLWALSRPGLPQSLPTTGEAPLIRALLDRESTAFSLDPALLADLTRAGVEMSPIGAADFVFLGVLRSASLLKEIRTGSDLYPDEGATAVVRARFGEGTQLRFTGPGVDGAVVLRVDGLPTGFWRQRDEAMRYPMGFDLFIIDGADVIGVPRSTSVEVL